ncbi:hypothetical protein TrLO_g4544 [Triparma laevis f. longispina]|nr:hypothetical protein TrLO_g4544 [Triparma laevis f. longispina]
MAAELNSATPIPALKKHIQDATIASKNLLAQSKSELEGLKVHVNFGLERLRANAAKGNAKAKDNLDMFEGWLNFANAMLSVDEDVGESQSQSQSQWQIACYLREVKFGRKLPVTQWPEIENEALVPIAEEVARLYLKASVEGVKNWTGYPTSVKDLVECATVMERIKDGERPDPSSIVCGDSDSDADSMIYNFLKKYKSVAESSWMNFLCGRKTDTSGLDGVVTWSDSEMYGLTLVKSGGAFEGWVNSKTGEAPVDDFPSLFEWKRSEIMFNVTFDWRGVELSELIAKVKDLAPSNVLNMLIARVLPNPELCVKDNLMAPCINVLRRKEPPTGAAEVSLAWTLLGLYYEFKDDDVRAKACFAKGVELSPSSAGYFGLCRVTPDGERIQFGGDKGADVKGGLPWGGMYCRWTRDKELSFGAILVETAYEFWALDAPIGGVCVEAVTWQTVAEEYYKNEMFSACLKACEKGNLAGEILGMARCRNCEYKEAMGMERTEAREFADYAKVRGRRGVVERAWEEGKRGLAMKLVAELEDGGGFVGLKDNADMKMIVGKGGREEYEELLKVVEEGGGGGDLAPFKNRVYHDIGVTHYEEGDHATALKFMVKSVEYDPKSAFGWNGAGVCLEALGREGGRECFEVAKACGKDNEGWINAVVCDWHAGRDCDKNLGELTSVSEHALSWLVRGLVATADGRKGGKEGILTAAKSYLKSAVGLVEEEDDLATERWRRVWEGMGGEFDGEVGGGERQAEVEAEAKEFDRVVEMVKNRDGEAAYTLETICEKNERILRGQKKGVVTARFAGEMKALRAWHGVDGGGEKGAGLEEAQMAAFFAPHSEFVRTAIESLKT